MATQSDDPGSPPAPAPAASPEVRLQGTELDRFVGLTLDLLCVAGFDGYFKFLNPAWAKTLGWTIAELCAKPYLHFVHPDDRTRTVDEAADISTGETTLHFRNRYLCRDGTYRWLLWNATPLVDQQLIYAAARDITDQVRAEAQKDELTALIVHDLKNPLASILLNARLAEEAMPAEEHRELARDIGAAAESMQRMIMNLLDIARSEDGALAPNLAEIEVKTFLDEVCELTRRRVEEGSKRLLVSSDISRRTIRADPDLLRRVLENLLDNSIRYAPPGSSIDVEAAAVENAVELRVRDQGRGVPEAYRERIFRKYDRGADSTATAARSSRGLGLVFCRMAVEAHGGQIWVEDNKPTGSVFCVRLPVGRPITFDVFLHGTASAAPEARRAAAHLVSSRLLVLAPEQVLAMLSAPEPVQVRAGLGVDLARKLVDLLRESGVRALCRPSGQPAPDAAAFVRPSDPGRPRADEVTTQQIRVELGAALAAAINQGRRTPA
jgi:PAS domain S-box-containing protein